MVGIHHGETGVSLVIGHGCHVRDGGQVRPREACDVLEVGGGETADDALGAAHQEFSVTSAQGGGAVNE